MSRGTIVFVFGIDGLVVWRDVHVVVGELVAAEVFEEVGDATAGEVDVGSAGVFGLEVLAWDICVGWGGNYHGGLVERVWS